VTNDLPEPQRHTGFLLRRTQQKHLAVWQSVVSGETTSLQYGVLAVLERRPGIAQKEIALELDIDKSTTADVCSRLEGFGLVTRHQDPADKRHKVLDLTPEGAAELARLRPLVDDVQDALTAGLTDLEHEELRRLLAKLLA
jgi:DNA-binding MarR family transcriptional regulator